MARQTRTVKTAEYARRKTKFGPRFKKVKQKIKKEKSKSPRNISDNQLIASETDSGARERMFAEKQRQATKRSAHRNLTTQVTTTGANVSSGIAASQGLDQNIAGGATKASTNRDDDNRDDEETDVFPPAY